MALYKDQQGGIHDDMGGDALPLLPQGCVEITDVEADAIRQAGIIPPTTEEITADIERDIDLFVDSVAEAKGYGTATLCPTAACMIYAGYANQYQAEAVAFGEWKAANWPIIYAIQVDVVAKIRPMPTSAEIIAELPPMVWPV